LEGGFLKHKSTHQKGKTTSIPQVDMEKLKRQLRREHQGGQKPILESQEIQFPNIAGVMSEEERRKNLAFTVVAPITTGPIDKVARGGRP
jgi:hypothetical protein